jgi:hypothetical protein
MPIAKTLCAPEVESNTYGHVLVFTSRISPADLDVIATVRFTPCLLRQFVPKAFEVRATRLGALVRSQPGECGED